MSGREFFPIVGMPKECSEEFYSQIESMKGEDAYCIDCPMGMGENVTAFDFKSDEYEKTPISKIYEHIKVAEGIPNYMIFHNDDKKCFCLVQTTVTGGDPCPRLSPIFKPKLKDDDTQGLTPGM